MVETDVLSLAGEGIALTVDRRTGAIARLESTETGWRVQDPPEITQDSETEIVELHNFCYSYLPARAATPTRAAKTGVA